MRCECCGTELSTIPVDISNDTLLGLTKIAHEKNITLNKLIVDVLLEDANRVIKEHDEKDQDLIDAIDEIGKEKICESWIRLRFIW